jgi:hypothetical protein
MLLGKPANEPMVGVAGRTLTEWWGLRVDEGSGVLETEVETEPLEEVDEALLWEWWWAWCSERTDETEDEVDLRPRRPVGPDERRTAERGVRGEGESECRLYEPDVCRRGGLPGIGGVVSPGELGEGAEEPAPPAAAAFFAAYPLATTPLGRLTVGAVDAEMLVGYLLVCGRGLFSFDFPSLPPAGLGSRLGVDWLPRLFEFLCRLVFSNNQWVQFFHVATMACDGRFLAFFESSGCDELFRSSASLVVTRWSVDPLDRALRKTPSFGGGIGLRCLEELTERIESLSMGGGGTSLSGLRFPFATFARSDRSGMSGIDRPGK